jgi:hypothetical protein
MTGNTPVHHHLGCLHRAQDARPHKALERNLAQQQQQQQQWQQQQRQQQ